MRPKSERAEISAAQNSVAPSGLRRSQRLILDVTLVIRGTMKDSRPFREETFTITVNAHGGLVVLENRVALGQTVVFMNPQTWDEREATFTPIGPPYAGLATMGFQFARPSPEFWAIFSPPPD